MSDGGRLPDTAHLQRPWRIHDVAYDFELEDVWELPGTGEQADFARVVEMICTTDLTGSGPARWLWALRWKLGSIFGWDDAAGGLGARVSSLRERLPGDLAGTELPSFAALPFTPLYLTADEFAAEIANDTMHGVMHLGGVERGGLWRVQMAVLVKPNGLRGRAYMAAIRPARHLIVYPTMLKRGAQLWEARAAA